MFDGDEGGAGAPGDDDGTQDDDAAQAGGSSSGASRERDRGGEQRSDGRRKPLFSDEQNRWIGARMQREEDRRRAVEGERDAAREKATGLEGRVSTLERDYRLAQAENAVIAAAATAKAENPAHIYRMVKDDLHFAEDGTPKDVAALIEQFKKDNPRYFGVTTVSGADGGQRGEATTEKTMNDIIRDGYANSKIRTVRSTRS